jgi:hypothetical protein
MKSAEKEIEALFSGLKGKLAWGIHRGYGSALFIEFGRPHLSTREPTKGDADSSDTVAEFLAQRQVFPQGEWGLLVTGGDWRISTFKKKCHCYDAHETVDTVLARLDGQRVTKAVYDKKTGAIDMSFDLGGLLTVRPPEVETYDQYWLFSDSNCGRIYAGKAGSVSGSKKVQCKPGNITRK